MMHFREWKELQETQVTSTKDSGESTSLFRLKQVFHKFDKKMKKVGRRFKKIVGIQDTPTVTPTETDKVKKSEEEQSK